MSQFTVAQSGGGGGGGITTINTDDGSVTGSAIDLLASTGAQKAGSSVSFIASSATEIDLITTDANLNTLIGEFAGNASLSTAGAGNTGLGYTALFSLTTGAQNVGIGYSALFGITDGGTNIAIGPGALGSAGSSNDNIAIGSQALQGLGALAPGNNNVAIGSNALTVLDTGSDNTAIGSNALSGLNLATSNNIAIGSNSGSSYTNTENSNIIIGNPGTAADVNTTRIGEQGNGAGQQNKCFIAGITGVTVTGTAVLCSTSGQLGTVVSSLRYKENVQEMADDVSILKLKPSEFTYKNDETKTKHYGLIAEEVHEHFPYLCFYNREGLPESVGYHNLPIFLLKEIQRINERVIELENKLKDAKL